jgi:hypothetical protein
MAASYFERLHQHYLQIIKKLTGKSSEVICRLFQCKKRSLQDTSKEVEVAWGMGVGHPTILCCLTKGKLKRRRKYIICLI